MRPCKVWILVKGSFLPDIIVIFLDESNSFPQIFLLLDHRHFMEVMMISKLFFMTIDKTLIKSLMFVHIRASIHKNTKFLLIECALLSLFLKITGYNFIFHTSRLNFF